ncbi:hypothetical protein [Neorhizobium alkalisoli]|uniref:Uncharacterized protein n=1 Tax=Neorhizobium alkalisoli TaxID=528178 RepID=A0A561QHE9_9HYPH|nr:hypothetical protein [Neorhizobium alkalisoli]TWF49805.1 hypothetical protein FHW37_107172 [Neorhizobium alkalisoli]
MRFFTSEWATGDDESDAVANQQNFLNSLDPDDPVYSFATSVNLHDARLDRVVFDSATRHLKLLLLSGDLQVGYWRTEISYADAAVQGRDILAAALDTRSAEVWYDEFYLADNRMTHAFLLVPESLRGSVAQEFEITFTSFSYTQQPIEGRVLATADNISIWS